MSIAGKYKLVKSENFDEYMQAIGVDLATRTLVKASSPSIEVKIDGDTYTAITHGLKTYSVSFKLGVEQAEKSADGRNVKSIYTLDGNVLTQIEKDDKGESKIVREFKGDDVIVTITRGNIVCKRHYKRE